MPDRYPQSHWRTGNYEAWKYRKVIAITTPASPTGYQHKITVAWEYGMNADFSDLRFTELNDTACNYYIETKTDSVTATVWVKVASALQYQIYLYYGNSSATSESSGANTFNRFNQFAGSGIDRTVDNNGVERRFYKNDFSNNTIADFTLTGAPSIASGVCTIATTEKIIKALAVGDTTGKWDTVAKYTTAWSAPDQSGKLYFGATSYIDVIRKTGNAIWLQLTVNGSSLIAGTDTTTTLADNTYGQACVTYDGTNYQMCWNGVAVGSATAGGAPSTPSIGLLATASTIVLNEIMYLPSVAHTDLYGSDTEANYMQLASTNITQPSPTGTWAAAAAGDVVVSGGYMTLSSDNDEAVAVALRSYNFASGEIEFSLDNNNDGGGGADSTGLLFAYQDILNHYKLVIEDNAAGAENLKIYKVVAGTATQLGTTKDVSATYTRGNKTWLKLHYSRETGQMWAYLRDDAGVYPTTPDISDAFSAQFAYGKVGYWSAVTTLGAGNLSVRFDDLVVRANLLIGETNVPVTESGFYFRDEFTVDDYKNWTTLRVDWSVTGGYLLCVNSTNSRNMLLLNPVVMTNSTSTLTVISKIYRDAASAVNGSYGFGFNCDREYLGIPINGYLVQINSTDKKIYIKKETASTLTTLGTSASGVTFNNDTWYWLKATITTAGLITASWSSDGVTYADAITATDTTFTNGRICYQIDAGSTAGTTMRFDNLTISGTRYYNKPMLRGAQIGENAAGACSRYITDFNHDVLSEFTGISSSTIDTNNGRLTLIDTTDIYPTGLSPSTGVYYADIQYVTNTAHITFTVADNTIEIDHAGAVKFNGAAAEAWTVDVPSAIVRLMFVATGTQIAVYSNGILKGTKTGLNLTASNYKMKRTTANYYITFFGYDAIEPTSTNGIAITNGSVAHGALWSTGITAGYLMREYMATEPVPEVYTRQLNPAVPHPIYTDGNQIVVVDEPRTAFTGFQFTNGKSPIVAGDHIILTDYDLVAWGSADVVSVVTSGTWADQNAYGDVTVTNIVGSGDVSGFSVIFTNRSSMVFQQGSVEIQPGDTITGADSGETAVVMSVLLRVGSWAGGDAYGTLIVRDVSGDFTYEETLDSTSGGVAVLGSTVLDPFVAYGYSLGTQHKGSFAIADPVMYYQMIDWHLADIVGGVTVTPSIALQWGINLNGTVVARPVSPTANIYIPAPTAAGSLMVSASASQNMTDKMMRASFAYDRAFTGETPNFYFKAVNLQIPDYTGTMQTVFVGFFPSGSVTYGAEGDSELATAYDYSWYLTMQYLTDDNMVLLTPADQLLSKKYRLYYNNPAAYWTVGQIVEGGTNHNIGKIIEVHLEGAAPVNELSYIEMESVSGTKVGGYYFADDETLLVNGILNAYADGHEVDVTGTPPIVYPDDYVARLLGGDNAGSKWETTTGINPYRLANLPAWSDVSTPPAVQFAFDEKTTKFQAIEQICKYIKYVFMVKFIGTVPCAYFVPEADIDDAYAGLDLPAAVTITPTDKYLVSPVTLERKGDEKYNKVTVRCQSLTGVWYQSVLPAGGVVDGIPIEYYEINQDIATQSDCDLRCADIYAYYCNQIKTWKATFNLRSDFRLLQKLIFSGSVHGIADGTYRIVGIEYDYADGGTTNRVSCTLILDTQFRFYLNLNRVFTDSISEIQNIVQDQLNKEGKNEIGEVLSVDAVAGTMSVRTESGVIKTVRNPT